MRENRLSFTKSRIEKLLPPGQGRVVYHDEQQRNLILRVSSNGSKVFYVRRKVKSISERVQIGRFPELSVEQARKMAASILNDIAIGNNPKEVARKQKGEPTLGELHQLYMEGHARQQCVRLHDMQKDFERYVGDWSDKKYTQIRRIEVQARVNHVRDKNGPGAANHLIILMRAVFNWHLRNETITGDNPWAGIKQYKIQSRERFLRPEELVRFFDALALVNDQTIHDYVLISLYTGARRANVLAMRWDQIDFDLAIWRIPLTKNKESHFVPLTDAAIAVLSERKGETTSQWVFPGKNPENHLVEPKRAWYSLLKKADIEDLRIHDLRRTLASYMAINNHNLPIIAKTLGHKSIAATQIYAKLVSDPVRQAMESAQSNMHSILKSRSAKGSVARR